MKFLILSTLALAAIAVVGCNKTNDGGNAPSPAERVAVVVPTLNADAIVGKKRPAAPFTGLNFDYSADEILQICDAQKAKLLADVDQIAATPLDKVTKDNSILALEQTFTDFGNANTPISFFGYSSTNDKARDAGSACEEDVNKARIDIFANRKLFNVLVSAQKLSAKFDKEENFLLEEYLIEFKRNGLALNDDLLAKYVAMGKQIAENETKFALNLVNDKTAIEVAEEKLKKCGLSDKFIATLEKKSGDDKTRFVTGKSADYLEVARFCNDAEIRRALEAAYQKRGGEENKKLLQDTLRLRDERAKLYFGSTDKNYADFALERRMAKSTKDVVTFLTDLKGKLKPSGEKDLALLRELKAAELNLKPSAVSIEAYDWRYYENKLKTKKLSEGSKPGEPAVDLNSVSEYFPLSVVKKGMFEIYQTLLGVKFVLEPSIKVWHSDVEAYRVEENGKPIAYFYMDLLQRKEGKYAHAAAFSLVSGYRTKDGSYQLPSASIITNFPKQDPVLIPHDQVETLFHEFGHIMHGVLTRARFGYLSGTNVKQDFVEAPSQMLENWVWNKQMLSKLSGHYKDNAKKLPEPLLKKLLELKTIDRGIFYLRQLAFATLDMQYHVFAYDLKNPKDRVDTTKIFYEAMKDIMLIPINDVGLIPEASFGHLMGGYGAGYYSYLWSEVYAQDMFTKFEAKGLMNPVAGKDYRTWILEPGGSKDPMDLIRGFLEREPNNKAFLKKLGISQ